MLLLLSQVLITFYSRKKIHTKKSSETFIGGVNWVGSFIINRLNKTIRNSEPAANPQGINI